MKQDPYLLTQERIAAPPVRFRDKLKFLGPGFVLSASIVGSGELIATTTLGAQAGFITFWVIIISCLVKVAVQLEFGRHTILTGETAMQAFNRLPGPKFGKAKWAIWLFFFLMVVKILQVGGVLGGVAIILHLTFPALPLWIWVGVIAVVVSLMIFRGYYSFIEKFSLIMIAVFTIFTFVSLFFLNSTPYAIQWEDVQAGLGFNLPKEAVAVAFGAFGITGVGGDEIIAYTYWCLEKGYAAKTGPPEQSADYEARAKGWMNVMYLDAILAMIVYTLVTAAFYLLGAAVLHAQGEVPEGYQMVETLSSLYTESLGAGAKTAFMLGSFIVLFSTLFAALAAWTRQFSDVFGQIGWIDFFDLQQRQRSIATLAWVFPVLWGAFFLFIEMPVFMVLTGGIVGSLILFMVVFAALYFRYRETPASFRPSKMYDLFFWLSVVSIILVGVYGIAKLL
ncbi:MAG: Nramp family divalent metal transporter [Saprospiraceae bacterium]|nr:Nramp family divalent metal transporter [Saprospiraceae bacterium]